MLLLSLVYENKSVGETGAQPAPNNNNGILKYAAIPVPLKYLNNYQRSLEMPLINYKVELKLVWLRQCVLSSVCVDNVDPNADNINFTVKIICSCSHFISKRQSTVIKTS